MKTETSFVLSNGLKCVHLADKSVVEMAGVFVNAGSRNDPDEHPGLAHFVEHTIFKGTQRRSSWHINNRMEAVGGELNAFTSKEETFVYTFGPKGSASRAIELLADLVKNPTFPEREIDIERGVITDEIDSYLDAPAEAVFDDFEDLLFACSPLGHNILGTHSSVAGITSAECRRFVAANYIPRNMVFFYVGPSSASRIATLAERHFADLRHDGPSVTTAPVLPAGHFDITRHIDSHQANTVMGLRTPGRTSPLRLPLLLLANMLGGPGMNAMLNLELRERRGLVYSVDASTTFYSDCGMFAIAYGCDPANEERCRNIITRLLEQHLGGMLTHRRIEAAKKQFVGQTVLRNDYRETRACNAARTLFFNNHTNSLNHFIASVSSISADTLVAAAAEFLNPSAMSRLTLL